MSRRIKQYEEYCAVCGVTMEIWAYKTSEISLYFNLGALYEEKPLCSHACHSLYNINPLIYDGIDF